MPDWKIVELNPDGSQEWNFYIPYQWMDKNYGRAEFSICAKWKYGRITDLWISRAQQRERSDEMYHINVVTKSRGLSVSHEANVWMITWCKTHKAQCFDVYVAPNTNTLFVSLLSTVSLMFIQRDEHEALVPQTHSVASTANTLDTNQLDC